MAVDDSYTVSLIHFEGADASTVFTDESGKVWTAVGAAQIDTADFKIQQAAGLFNSDDSITTPDSADFTLGSADFTIEMWAKASVITNRRLCGQGNATATASSISAEIIVSTDTFNASVYSGSTAYNIFADSPVSGAWEHLALVRYSDTLKFYINGTAQTTTRNLAGITVNDSVNLWAIGQRGENTTFRWVGWIDEFRFSKGIARYTANFSPPTGPFMPGAGALSVFADGYSIF